MVAVGRGDDLLVEFGDDFTIRPDDAIYLCGSASAVQNFYRLFPQH